MRATTATHIQAQPKPGPTKKHSRQRKTSENQRQPSQKAAAAKTADYYQLVARATNDAVRDWDLTGSALTWPQGLDTLLGYHPGTHDQTIAFWQQRIHSDDRSRAAGSIADDI